MLDVHRSLWRQKTRIAVDRRSKLDPLLGDPSHFAEAEHLETAGIGEDRTVPAHETMQPAVHPNDVRSGTQPQVKRVAEDHLCPHATQVKRAHGLDRAIGADRHECRRFHHAMRQREPAPACRTVPGNDVESHTHGLDGAALSINMASP